MKSEWKIEPNDPRLTEISLMGFRAYLESSDWKLTDHSNGAFLVFLGSDKTDSPIRIVLPRSEASSSYFPQLSEAIHLLSFLQDKPADQIIEEIYLYILGCDRFTMRVVMDSGEWKSIPLDDAVTLLESARKLIKYAACGEHVPRPFFQNRPPDLANEFLRRCGFAHTFRGSFGIAIEVPLQSNPSTTLWKRSFGRRVMGRIAHGLFLLSKAVQDKDIGFLTDHYANGLNGNMCDALREAIGVMRTGYVEYGITWSVREPPPEELRSFQPVIMDSSAFDLLDEAAKVARDLARQPQTAELSVRGVVTDLHRDWRMRRYEGGHIVAQAEAGTITIVDENTHQPTQVFLEPELYREAVLAHLHEKLVTAKGSPRFVQGRRRLLPLTHFSVVEREENLRLF